MKNNQKAIDRGVSEKRSKSEEYDKKKLKRIPKYESQKKTREAIRQKYEVMRKSKNFTKNRKNRRIIEVEWG